MTLGRLPISETEVTIKKRSGVLPGLCAAMKEIFITPKWNEKVFEILESKTTEGKKRTGRHSSRYFRAVDKQDIELACKRPCHSEVI